MIKDYEMEEIKKKINENEKKEKKYMNIEEKEFFENPLPRGRSSLCE